MYEFGVPYFISEGNFPYFDCTNRVSAVQRHPPHCSPITVVTPSTTTHCCYSCVCFSLAVQGCNPADGIALTLAEPNSVPTAFKLSFHVTLASTPGGGNPYKLVIWGQVPCPCCVTVQPPQNLRSLIPVVCTLCALQDQDHYPCKTENCCDTNLQPFHLLTILTVITVGVFLCSQMTFPPPSDSTWDHSCEQTIGNCL